MRHGERNDSPRGPRACPGADKQLRPALDHPHAHASVRGRGQVRPGRTAPAVCACRDPQAGARRTGRGTLDRGHRDCRADARLCDRADRRGALRRRRGATVRGTGDVVRARSLERRRAPIFRPGPWPNSDASGQTAAVAAPEGACEVDSERQRDGTWTSPIARTRKPIPVRSSATPMTIENSATFSAKKDVLSAVLSAVSVTHTFRAALSTGRPSFLSAAFSSLVPLPSVVAKRGIWA